MARSLIVLPDDSVKPILEAIKGAQRMLRVKMFVFSDPTVLDALIAAKRRGVQIRVMLNPARRNGEHENDVTHRRLSRAGIEVRDPNPGFALTHEKSMVVDHGVAVVQSLNWTTKNFNETRDYAIVTTRHHDVAEILECFEADWHRVPFDPPANSHLIWCPGHGRNRVCQFIDNARRRLFVQNERYQDMVVIEHLVRAARRGVRVHVMARAPHTLKKEKLVEGVGGLRILNDTGIKVHKIKRLRLHGKMMLADSAAALIGSINFAAGSFDGRRELAIEMRDDHVVDRLHRVAHHDWAHSHPLDLSDEGLLADLEDTDGSAEMLALDANDAGS